MLPGAPGQSRTDTPVKDLDFESSASTIPPQGHAGGLLAASRAPGKQSTQHRNPTRVVAASSEREGASMTTADFFVERLKAWGVRRIFGYSGDGINGVIGAIQRDGTIDFIQPRHEEMAAFMAVPYAKFSGDLGLSLATGGPRATLLLAGLSRPQPDHIPALP